ncbi:MAG: response regulator [Gammaproteobacteria bacterium]|nr:response regulator [Gammaproteobacteria bacterium]
MPQQILVVDDVEHVRKLIRKILESNGYDVVDYPSAIPALEFLQSSPVDLIISDLMMPGMDGYAFCREVKSNPERSEIPFVFVTAAFTDEIDRELASKVGAQAYITKPIMQKEFLQKIHELLDGQASQSSDDTTEEFEETEEIEKMYTEVLARKLDAKVQELEQERAALRKSEEHLRMVTNAIPELLFEFDSKLRYRYVNRAHANWQGLSEERSLGKKLEEILSTEAFQMMRPHIERALSGRAVTFEREIPDNLGIKRTMWGRLIPKYDERDRVDGVYAIMSDVTSRVEDRKHLERVNRALRTLTKINETIIHAVDEVRLYEDVCNILASEGGYQLVWLGMVENVDNKNVINVAHAGEEVSYLDSLDVTWDETESGSGPTGMAIKTGETHVVRNMETDKNYHMWREKATLHGFHSSVSIPVCMQDEIIGTINIYSKHEDAFDDSEVSLLEEFSSDFAFGIQAMRARVQRDYALRSLKDSEEHLRSIVDTAPSIMLWLSTDYRIHGLNQEGETILIAKQEEIFGSDFVEQFVDETSRDSFRQAARNALEGKVVRDVEINIIDSQSQLHNVSWNLNRLIDDSQEAIGIIAVGQDISLQKQGDIERENLQLQLQHAQKMEAIGQLTGGIAHDFNNILASIIGYTELALDRFADEGSGKLHAYLKEVHLAGMRAKDLIAQMLAFSRSKQGEYIALSTTPLIKETIKLLRPTIPASINMQFSQTSEVHKIQADPIQLQQVLMNLCINARDAISTHGTITISVDEQDVNNEICNSCHQSHSGHYLVLSVKDTGSGIPPDVIDRIFEPFLTTKDVGAGTGMGLSMVHGIVHNHKGHIRVDSTVGAGTDFRIYFPLDVTGLPELGESRQMGSGMISPHILVVDDEESVGRFIQALLEAQAYRVTIMTDSTQALSYFHEHSDEIDLVISDQTMPGMTGLDMLKQMLGERPQLPVVLATGFSHHVSEKEALEAGVQAFMKKPFDTDLLLETLSRILTGS